MSTSLIGIMSSRILAGAFSGNLGVLNSMLGELTTSSNQAKAFTTLPIAAGLVRVILTQRPLTRSGRQYWPSPCFHARPPG